MESEIKETIRALFQRLKSPFGITFIIIWLVLHWKPTYYFLFVDSDVPMGTRFEFFIGHFKFKDWWDKWDRLFLQPAWLSLIALSAYQFFLLISGVITGWFKRILEPKIAKWLGTAEVILKEEARSMERTINSLEKENRELKSEKNDLVSERDASNLRNAELNKIHIDAVTDYNTSKEELIKQTQEAKNALQLAEEKLNKMIDQAIPVPPTFDNLELWEVFMGAGYNYYDPDYKGRYHGPEQFKIKNNEYWVGDKKIFEIKNIHFDKGNNFLNFDKVRPNGEILSNSVFKSEPLQGLFVGVESNMKERRNYSIKYSTEPIPN
jgi:hypothetical protein